ncbi:hypothetical protein OG618_37300 (plasmid) [Kitasatospora sp. NBC_01246]|uniref:hypothetical protein n=1 Tax=Kitasatospora sp. NBC_01246 TaxID=2903570 RepID=UPI002E3027F8|nr:hypothetical protein [Kitasatospora sp. NBC_01246]
MANPDYYKSRSEHGGWILCLAESVDTAAGYTGNTSVRHTDGSVEITYERSGHWAHFEPVTDAEAQQIMDDNRAFGAKVEGLLEPVREALRAADDVLDGKHMFEPGYAARGGVVAFVSGAAVHVHWWYLTYAAQRIAERAGRDPWRDGGAREATLAVLQAFAAKHGCTVTEDRDSFLVSLA